MLKGLFSLHYAFVNQQFIMVFVCRFVPDSQVDNVDPWSAYGVLATLILSAIRLLPLLAVPQLVFNLIGLMRFNAFADRVTLKSSPLLAPFICVRVVTRGMYPNLVRQTVSKNLETLADAGFENFVYEVVTDTPVNLAADGSKRVKETVVPSTYKTKTGALNKSRALQYCLEVISLTVMPYFSILMSETFQDDVNMLNDDDWIVHLDEETLLTENCVRGILNFVGDGKHDFGQGLITYASNPPQFKSWSKFFQNRSVNILIFCRFYQ